MPMGPPVLLTLSFYKIFEIIINSLKQTDKEDPKEDPVKTPYNSMEDPMMALAKIWTKD